MSNTNLTPRAHKVRDIRTLLCTRDRNLSMWSEPLRDLRAPLTRHTAPRHAPGVAKASSSPRPWPGTALLRKYRLLCRALVQMLALTPCAPCSMRLLGVRAQRYFVHYISARQSPSPLTAGDGGGDGDGAPAAGTQARRRRAWLLIHRPRAARRVRRRRRGCQHRAAARKVPISTDRARRAHAIARPQGRGGHWRRAYGACRVYRMHLRKRSAVCRATTFLQARRRCSPLKTQASTSKNTGVHL